ncbi:glycosyltransferase [Lactobacillus helveticus]|uniref:glycosyltransferase n=1 Tax=Lactobacillus helveticus TaxID=1587 RepID=UPI001562C80F|nr:glycosyltransferase [Lactobacillus helveticus]NRO27418.1 hypothetical protein [Lactobacillus helveticus]
MKIIAGIVLFNPDIKRLIENVNAVSSQVDEIIFFDNNSINLNEIETFVKRKNYQLIKSNKNYGIAHALNELGKAAYYKKADWFLTLDQDTVINLHLIEEYKKYMNLPRVGQLCCIFKDRNLRVKWDIPNGVKKSNFCITSASLVNLRAWKEVGGFDESMFIDAVDNDFCAALIRRGYFNYQIDFVGFMQEIGHATKHHFIYKDVYTLNHSAFRRYYIARNNMLIARRYKTETNSVLRELMYLCREIIIIILFEKNKMTKLNNYFRGIIDGMTENTVRRNYLKDLK